jgi:hypothetical protein
MDLTHRWPVLAKLCACAAQFPDLQIWAFGSMLRVQRPQDLDVLILYTNPDDVNALYAMHLWEVTLPLLHIIAMTPDEEHDYDFVKVTGAIRIFPER